jgi:hypothetical protein
MIADDRMLRGLCRHCLYARGGERKAASLDGLALRTSMASRKPYFGYWPGTEAASARMARR